MNGKHHKLVMALLVSMAATEARAQDAIVDQLTVPFSDPARPGTIRVGLLNGSIRVVGYEGKDVQLTARVRSDGSEVENDQDDDSQRAKSAGMRRLHNTSTGLVVEEDDNIMEVQIEGMNRTVDVTLKVPHRISLELNTTNDGDIDVDGVEGEFEVNNTNGPVTLTNVSGSVVAHALNEDLVVRFLKVDPKKSMSFSSMNGDIDVTLPAAVKADVRIKSDNGEIYTDFDIQMSQHSPRVEETKERTKGKKYQVRVDNSMTGSLNGGGPELRFESFNGNIYIRKK